MDEKIIKIDENNYLVATGDVKQIKGNITKEELLRIYKLRDLINTVNEEINNQKNQLNNVKDIKQFRIKELLKFRIVIITTLVCGLGYIGIHIGNILFLILTGISCAVLYCLCEKALKEMYGTKEQNEVEEKKINTSIENKYQKLKEYEKELTEIIERTNYQEKNIEKEKTWDDLFYTEEEIKLYTQESPAPFNPETIFTNVENAEEPIDDLQYELNGPRLVRKLTQQKNNSNNNI